MARSRYKIFETAYPYFMTSTFVHGYPFFGNPTVARLVLNSLKFLQHHREVTLYCYVLMENHWHIIAQGDELSEKMRHFKSYTAKEIIKIFKQNNRTHLLRQLRHAKLRHKTESTHQVWQESFHPQQIIGDNMMIQKLEYIHDNPVKRGYVDQPTDWRYSSARNYAKLESLIPITLYHR